MSRASVQVIAPSLECRELASRLHVLNSPAVDRLGLAVARVHFSVLGQMGTGTSLPSLRLFCFGKLEVGGYVSIRSIVGFPRPWYQPIARNSLITTITYPVTETWSQTQTSTPATVQGPGLSLDVASASSGSGKDFPCDTRRNNPTAARGAPTRFIPRTHPKFVEAHVVPVHVTELSVRPHTR